MKSKVLVVEDDDIFLEVMTSMLQYAGYDTLEALNGKDGLESFMKFKPDLIVSDIMMPVLNGIEMTKRIFSSQEPVPVILMSGFTSNSALQELQKSPYWAGFFSKPFEEEDMLNAVKLALAKK